MSTKEPDEKYYCPECLEEVDENAVKCPHCNAEYEAGEVEAGFECMICNFEVEPNAKHCPRCGTIFMNDKDRNEPVVKQIGEHNSRSRVLRDMEMDDD